MRWIAYSLLATAAMTDIAWGHGSANHNAGKKPARAVEETAFGRAGNSQQVSRTIRIDGRDNMRYTPSEIRVRQGETIRFVVANRGKLLHETVLGTRKDLDAHYELMKKFPDMEHDEPHMVHLKPGQTGEMIWQFTKAGEFYFACLMPGHYDAGMMGTIVVTPAGRSQ